MDDDFGAPRSVRGFKILTIVGCAGTLIFLWLEAYRENVSGEYRSWQTSYVERIDPEFRASFEIGIKQAFLPELDRVDRCQSCHVGIDDPTQVNSEQPLRTHSGELLAAHLPEDFGCTVCHQGQGRAVSLPEAHGHVSHWEEPMLKGDLVYTSCGRCHAENALFGHEAEVYRTDEGGGVAGAIDPGDLAASITGADLLSRGKALVATSGCLGCHTYRGRGGSLGPNLTHIGDRGVHGYDFSHLPPGIERTPLGWLKAHFMNPGAVSPGTVMPGVGTGAQDAIALAAYMLSLRTQDVPAHYRPAPPASTGAELPGAQLYDLFCVACHGRDLAGGDVPEIRTPSLSNEDFLSVAGDDYLRYIIEHGRSGTEMPAWGEGAGGLTGAQIDRIVSYIRSFEPQRSDVDEALSLVGDPLQGRAIFRGSCAACHGVAGEGGIGTRLNSPDFLGMASDEFLLHTIIEGRPGTGMPSWRTLESQSVADVVAYLRTWEETGAEVAEVLDRLAAGSGETAMGARLFESRCATCHGRDARGMIGPSLNHDEFLSIASDAYLTHAILEGRPGTAMPAWRDLAAEDVVDLITYLRSLSDSDYAPPDELLVQGDPASGELLYARTCVSCHGNDAVGGMGPQLRNPNFLAHASDGFLFHTIATGRDGTPMRGFARTFGGPRSGGGTNENRYAGGGIAELSEVQIADIVAWLRSLEGAAPTEAWRHPALGSASRGREIYEEQGSCAKCHGYQGQGGIGPALGNPLFLEHASEGFLLGTMVRGRANTEMRRFTRDGIASLSAESLMDVAAYVRTLGDELPEGRAGWRRYHATRDRIAVGAELYSYYCSSCHGSDGVGGYAPELNNPEFLFAASDGHLVATIARGRIGTPMRPFGPGPASMATLDHEELRALVAYIRSWEEVPGAEPAHDTSPPGQSEN